MKTIKDAKARMIVGTRLLCVENTYRPELNGTFRTVTKAPGTTWKFRMDGSADKHDSYSVWGSGIEVIDADTIKIPLRTPFGHKVENHSVTLRFVATV